MNYYGGPLVWDANAPGGGAWRAPAGTIAMVDLRSIPAQAAVGGSPAGSGFFATEGTLDSSYELLGTSLDATFSAAMANKWQAKFGVKPDSATLVDALVDTLSVYSDPTGETGPKPLMPDSSGLLEVHLQGHSCVWRGHAGPSSYGKSRARWGKIKQTFQLDYEGIRATAIANGSDEHQRLLGFWRDTMGRWEPGRLADPATLKRALLAKKYQDDSGDDPKRPRTWINETFTKADSTTLGPKLAWVEIAGDAAVKDNKISNNDVNTVDLAYANSPLSGANQSCKMTIETSVSGNSTGLGPCCRFSNSATTFYVSVAYNSFGTAFVDTRKWVAGSQTILQTVGVTFSLPQPLELLVSGSQQLAKFNNALATVSSTDTAISSNLYCGVLLYGPAAVNQAQGSTWVAKDIIDRQMLVHGGMLGGMRG